jgi:tellurite resistance protein
MRFEEPAAYALASWQRFDSEVTDDVARAIVSAFALVAIADGDLAQSEIDRFTLLIAEQKNLLASLGTDRFDMLFRDIGAAILSDPIAGCRHALDLIAAVKSDAGHCELVRSAAECAIGADSRELASEREVMAKICNALAIEVR